MVLIGSAHSVSLLYASYSLELSHVMCCTSSSVCFTPSPPLMRRVAACVCSIVGCVCRCTRTSH